MKGHEFFKVFPSTAELKASKGGNLKIMRYRWKIPFRREGKGREGKEGQRPYNPTLASVIYTDQCMALLWLAVYLVIHPFCNEIPFHLFKRKQKTA